MHPIIQDTIVALSSVPGGAGRAIVRLSGPRARQALSTVFRTEVELPPPRNRVVAGTLHLTGLHVGCPAELYWFAAPNSYTGQDLAEIHLVGCVPLVERLIADLLANGCRSAGPGEFTMRAFLAGKVDLTRAEAVHAVIEATGRADLTQALEQLAGGVARPLSLLREDLLNLLADVEAGLDFVDEDIRFVDTTEMLLRLGRALAQVTLVVKQLAGRAVKGSTFRVVLAGRPNAGKSRLFNSLTGARVKALVSDTPGTTRDYLTRTLEWHGVQMELIDTPGIEDGGLERAQALGAAQHARADLVLWCSEMGVEPPPRPEMLCVATKCDLQSGNSEPDWGTARLSESWLQTSALTGHGLQELRAELTRRAHARAEPALAPSLSRCQHHAQQCLEHLRRAHSIVLEEDPPEILALEIREALQQLGEMVGAVYTDDLLDRVFSRFCIGK